MTGTGCSPTAETRRFRPGEVVLPDGRRPTARCTCSPTAGSRSCAPARAGCSPRIEAPATIGEAEFLDGRPRSVALRAIGHGEIERLSWEAFEALSAREPQLARDILVDVGRVLAARLRAGAGSVGV